MKGIERILLYIVCFTAFGNLYYVAPLFGLSYNTFLITCLIISFLFSFKHLIKYRKTYYTKFFLLFFTMSLVLVPVNMFKGYEFRANDMIRVFWYVSLLNWILAFCKKKNNIEKFVKRLLYYLIILFVLLSAFEYFNKTAFVAIVYGELPEEIEFHRLAITFRDSNSYAAVVSLFLFIIIRLEKNIYFQILTIIISAELINLSGSRMGVLLLFIIVIWWLIKRVNTRYYIPICATAILFILTIGVTSNSHHDEEQESAISRIFAKESAQYASAQKSSVERQNSIKDGLEFGISDNMIIPAGSFYFDYKWRHTSNHDYHFPHSSFVYLFCEYGVYCLFFFGILFKLLILSKKKNELLFFLIVVIPLLLLPNIVYIFPLYLGSFIIEFNLFDANIMHERDKEVNHYKEKDFLEY